MYTTCMFMWPVSMQARCQLENEEVEQANKGLCPQPETEWSLCCLRLICLVAGVSLWDILWDILCLYTFAMRKVRSKRALKTHPSANRAATAAVMAASGISLQLWSMAFSLPPGPVMTIALGSYSTCAPISFMTSAKRTSPCTALSNHVMSSSALDARNHKYAVCEVQAE
jgi:hypothetical protein